MLTRGSSLLNSISETLVVFDVLALIAVKQDAELEPLVAQAAADRINHRRIGTAVDIVEILVVDRSVAVIIQKLVAAREDIAVPCIGVARVGVDVVDRGVIASIDQFGTRALSLIGRTSVFLIIGHIGRILVLGDPVFVETRHQIDIVTQPVTGRTPESQFDFNAVLLHFAVVHLLERGSHQNGNDRRHKHVFALLVEEIDVERQLTVEPSHLNAQIALARRLPPCLVVGHGILGIIAVIALRIRAVIEPPGSMV